VGRSEYASDDKPICRLAAAWPVIYRWLPSSVRDLVRGAKVMEGLHPITYRLEPHGGQDATVTLFLDEGAEKFRPTGQLLASSGTPLVPPYDIPWRLAPGVFSDDTTKTVSAGEYQVLCLARQEDHGNGTVIDFTGSHQRLALGRDQKWITRSVDMDPVRLRVTIRGNSGLFIEREYLVTWSGEHAVFQIQQSN